MSLPVEITSLPLKKVVMEEPYVFPPERARSPNTRSGHWGGQNEYTTLRDRSWVWVRVKLVTTAK